MINSIVLTHGAPDHHMAAEFDAAKTKLKYTCILKCMHVRQSCALGERTIQAHLAVPYALIK